MANLCVNIFHAYSENLDNIKAIEKFFDDNNIGHDSNDKQIDAWFESKWTFPEELMNDLFESIPDKENIYMKCLSFDSGNDYVAYWKCEDKTGWYQHT